MTTPTMTPAGWYTDPSLRHEYRFWNGTSWTSHVSDRGVTATDSELRPPTSPAGAPTVRPLAVPAAPLAAPAGPGSDVPQSTMATPTLPMPPGFHGPGQGPATLSTTTPAPVAARGGGRRWAVPVVSIIAVLALIVGLVIWAPWVSKVPAVPAAIRAQSPTATSVLVRWPSATADPTVDAYVIRRDGVQVGFIPGTVTSYQDRGLAPDTTYRYSVVAVAGGLRSAPSSVLAVKTLTPPISAARLQGSWTVSSKVVKSGGGTLKVGTTTTETWQFRPKCTVGPCAVVLSGVQGGSTHPHLFTMTLTRAGAVYKGTTKAHITHCGKSTKVKDVLNTVTLQMTVKRAGVGKRAWTASSWVGAMKIASPYTSASGGWYCPAQSVTSSLAASR